MGVCCASLSGVFYLLFFHSWMDLALIDTAFSSQNKKTRIAMERDRRKNKMTIPAEILKKSEIYARIENHKYSKLSL